MTNQNQNHQKNPIHWSKFLWLFSIPILYQFAYSLLIMFLQDRYPMTKDQALADWFSGHVIHIFLGLILIMMVLFFFHFFLSVPRRFRFSIAYHRGWKWGTLIVLLIMIFGVGESILSSELDNIIAHIDQRTIESDPKTLTILQIIQMQFIHIIGLFFVWIMMIQTSLAQVFKPKWELSLLFLSSLLYFPSDQLSQAIPSLMFSAWIFTKTRSYLLCAISQIPSIFILIYLECSGLKIEGYNDLSVEWQPIWFDIIGISAVFISFYALQSIFEHTKD